MCYNQCTVQYSATHMLALASRGRLFKKDIGSHFGVPRHQRVCQLCGTSFGDEMHLVFECAAMTDLRGQFPDIFQPHQTMQQFMWQPNLLQVAKFLDAGMKRLQTVDPDEGSNI